VDEGLVDPQELTQFGPNGIFDLEAYADWPGPRRLRGLAEFLEFRARWMEPYDDWDYEVEKIVDAGEDRVVATLHQRGKPRGSNSWVHMDYGIVYTLADGMIERAQMYPTPAEALEAAGLD